MTLSSDVAPGPQKQGTDVKFEKMSTKFPFNAMLLKPVLAVDTLSLLSFPGTASEDEFFACKGVAATVRVLRVGVLGRGEGARGRRE